MTATRSNGHVCFHGHFYQPPREDPWTRRVPMEPSATPHQNWNERITEECYRPNTKAKLLDAHGGVRGFVNNFERMSFDVGPTLLNWLEVAHPEVHRQIIGADQFSRKRLKGHGNAMAQPYVHLIMPLASRRDKVTQVRWGIQDFRRHYGRDPEGMWLPETAVDGETLEVLAEEGMLFTVLSPHQALRVKGPEGAWSSGESVDPKRAYRCAVSTQRSIAVFFYDEPLSHAMAFGGLLHHVGELEHRMIGSWPSVIVTPHLLHVALDGETFGHHFPGGETTLAYILDRFMAHGGEITNYGAFLTNHPPTWEAEIKDRTSWSCAHGVERWRADCGCRAGNSPSHQAWRGPLRVAMDRLRERVDVLFEERGSRVFRDPWAARDGYGQVVGAPEAAAWQAFWGTHQCRSVGPADEREAKELLEMARCRLFMYTSCGWFFDELSGLETLLILRYAARVLEIAERLTGRPWEESWLEDLEQAPSNVEEFRNGRGVWTHFIRSTGRFHSV